MCWTYIELAKREKELKTRQTAKLEMYQKLIKTLIAFVALWFLYAVGVVAVNQQYAEVASKWHFLVWGFWDVLYFLGLLIICIIWMPNERSAAYAYSQQLPTEDPDDAGILGDVPNSSSGNGVEMVGGFKSNEGAQFEIALPEDDDESDDEFDVHIGDDGKIVSIM